MKLTPGAQRWLKALHIVAACCWVGGALSLVLLHFIKADAATGGELFGINRSIHHVDMWVVVVPGAFGSLLTGLVFSEFTAWGFVRHNWVIFKWAVTIAAIAFGTIYLGPWEAAMMETSGRLGLASLADAEYLGNERMNLYFGALQLVVLVATVFVSVLKPWGSGR